MKTHRNGSDRWSRATGFAAAFAFTVTVAESCGGRTVRTTATDPTTVEISQLWQEPTDLESRDLFAGPGEGTSAPDATAPLVFVKADTTGYSPGYDLRDANGVTWSVKLGAEAQTEVVASRILWAIGYHQVPTYYLTTWTMTGGPEGNPGPGRFRPELIDRKVIGDWSWYQNEFVHTRPFNGLIVANLILNNWDWKTSNNKIYEVTGAGGAPGRRYVVRDLGASFGKTSVARVAHAGCGARVAQGNRNNLADFEQQGFITAAIRDRVEFDYSGIYEDVVKTVSAGDVVWASRLLSRLSDAQWNDAFRAAGYPPDQASRYVAKLKSKVAEGLALDASTGD